MGLGRRLADTMDRGINGKISELLSDLFFVDLLFLLSAFAAATSRPITVGLVWLGTTAAGITYSGHPELRSSG